jgi:hypothetical protein
LRNIPFWRVVTNYERKVVPPSYNFHVGRANPDLFFIFLKI